MRGHRDTHPARNNVGAVTKRSPQSSPGRTASPAHSVDSERPLPSRTDPRKPGQLTTRNASPIRPTRWGTRPGGNPGVRPCSGSPEEGSASDTAGPSCPYSPRVARHRLGQQERLAPARGQPERRVRVRVTAVSSVGSRSPTPCLATSGADWPAPTSPHYAPSIPALAGTPSVATSATLQPSWDAVGVRGHEKVPAGGQLEVLTLRSSCRGSGWAAR
jgi:hypothetical protein